MTDRKRLHPHILAALLIALTVTLTSLASAQPAVPGGGGLNLSLETLVPPDQLTAPVAITHASDERLFVVELEGRVRIARSNGAVHPTPFLDITSRVESEQSEQGLLGLAFHPDYAVNGYFYVNYTAEPDGDTRISRFTVSADPDVADPGSEQIVLEVGQPYDNHNGGDLLFGPDGYLYIPLGDGGSGNDPQNRAQNMQTLLGKLLRIDINGGGSAPDCDGGNYTIPADNPFSDGPGGDCDEIWALGLRNPWRASFDRQTGDLYMGDVGQRAWEEINMQPASSTGGENYGWPCYEGAHYNDDNNMPACEPASAYVMPIFELDSSASNCAVTGGYVYRGSRFPQMVGRYFLSDLCAPTIWDLHNVAGGWNSTRHDNMQSQLGGIVSFGESVYGELYLARINDGAIYHLVEDTVVSVEEAEALLPAVFK